jgi:hypothetical protein
MQGAAHFSAAAFMLSPCPEKKEGAPISEHPLFLA